MIYENFDACNDMSVLEDRENIFNL